MRRLGASERQQAIIRLLVHRRMETRMNLAAELGVDEKTIRRDVEALSLRYPVETVKGRGGGIRLAGWYRPGRKTLAPEQASAIRKAAEFLEGGEKQALLSVLAQFSSL